MVEPGYNKDCTIDASPANRRRLAQANRPRRSQKGGLQVSLLGSVFVLFPGNAGSARKYEEQSIETFTMASP